MNHYWYRFTGTIGVIILILTAIFVSNKYIQIPDNQNQRSPHHKHEYNDFFLSIRNYPHDKPDLKAYLKQIDVIKKASIQPLPKKSESWRLEGPRNLGGRINTLAINPNNSNIMYAGSAKGGIFKTNNGGGNWQPVFDAQSLLSVSKIVLDPNNSDIVYAGTGDTNISAFPSIGDGLYKSVDGGLSWKNIGLDYARIISDIYINPKNSNEIYVSAMGLPYERNEHRGLYKTIDGGKSWQKVLYVSNEVGIIDIAVHPDNSNIVYAAGWNRIRNNKESLTGGSGARVFKTTNGGISWKNLKDGLPQEDFSRIAIEMSPKNPNKLYATYVSTMHGYHSTFKTVDGGEKWTEFEYNSSQIATYGGPGQDFGWYFGKTRIDPKDDDILYVLGVDLWKVDEQGKKWERFIDDIAYDIHPDFHDLQFIDDNTVIAATDGGLYRGERRFNGEWHWEDIDDIPNSQFYRVAVNPHQSGIYGGGLQDNGSSQGGYLNMNDWTRIWGGDGFTVQYHPTDPARIFVTTQNGYMYHITDYGEEYNNSEAEFEWKSFNRGVDSEDRSNWDTPFLISRHDHSVLYKGTYRMYKTAKDTIADWKTISDDLTDGVILHKRYHSITTIDESPINANVLLAGTVDANVWITRNGGDDWVDIKYGLPERYITSVKASFKNDETIYVTQSGYKDNDNRPYIFRSTNSGKCWMSINGNLPAVALNDLAIYDNQLDNIIFVATDGGVFYSNNSGFSWQIMGSNMPTVPVYDIDIDYRNNRLIAGTYGRSMYSYGLDDIIAGTSMIANQTDTIPPVLSVNSPNKISTQLGVPFEYPLASASDNMDCDLTNAIKIEGEVDVNKKGIYFITYTVSDAAGNIADQTIQVTVAEDAPPTIYISSSDVISFWEGGTFYLPHATAQDDIDGDLTDALEIVHNININIPGVYSIIYTVTDSNGNMTMETITVNVVRDEAPVITIEGGNEISIDQYTPFELPVITAYDQFDGDLTADIVITNHMINVTIPGVYTIKIMVQDSFGNTAMESLMVTVQMVTAISLPSHEVSINIVPNPVSDMVYFKTDQSTIIQKISIFDLTGKLILKEDFSPQLNISHFQPAIYHCVFTTIDKQYFSLPLVKQ